MGYYLRFICTDDDELRLDTVERGLKALDPKYEIRADEGGKRESGELFWDGALYAEIEINRPGDGLFDDEVAELIEAIEDDDRSARDRVLEVLRAARKTIALRVLWQGRQTEETVRRFDLLWEWLFEHHRGLLLADGEGYYDADAPILETD